MTRVHDADDPEQLMPRSTTTTIDYTREGSGEPVVLVHGIGHRREAWGEVPDLLLAKGYQVIALDLPGFGRSPLPTKPDVASVDSTVRQLERLFAELDLDRPHVVGNSLGGLMALRLAARGSVRSAVTISPAGFVPPHHLPWVGLNLLVLKASTYVPDRLLRLFSDKAALRKISLRSLYVHPEVVPGDVAYADARNLRTATGFWPHFVRSPWLRYVDGVEDPERPRVPTTVAWGDTDRLLLSSQAQIARRRMPEATHVTLPHCGHCAQVDDPALVTTVIEETIARARSDRSV